MGGAQLGGVACCWLLIGCLGGGGQVLTHLLPLSLLDVIPGGVLKVSLDLSDIQGGRQSLQLHHGKCRK